MAGIYLYFNGTGFGLAIMPFFFAGKWLIAGGMRRGLQVFCLTRDLLGNLKVHVTSHTMDMRPVKESVYLMNSVMGITPFFVESVIQLSQ